jgi:hypothetical protein
VTNSDFGSVDGSIGNDTLTRTFDVSNAGTTITNVDILIDFSKCGNPAPGPNDTRCRGTGFSFNSDIAFQLMSPSETSVNLVFSSFNSEVATYSGQSPGARVSVTFDDQAATPVGGQNLQFGRFQPAEPLTFDTQSPNGTWTLILQDTFNGSFSNDAPLQFYSATLCINEACPAITSLRIGDVDSDDDRDAVDARLVLQALVGLSPPDAIHFSAAGDVNADGSIDNRDSILILAIVAGRIPPPPNPNSIEAVDNAQGIVFITGSPDATHANRTFNLSNPANGDTISVTTDDEGIFEDGEGTVTLDGVAGNTIIADIDGSPARAAILVQQDNGGGPALEGPASLALTQQPH